MDFDLTDKQTYWRDRIRDHNERFLRHAFRYYAEQKGDRWKVLGRQEEKARAKERNLELCIAANSGACMLMTASLLMAGPHQHGYLCAPRNGRIGFLPSL